MISADTNIFIHALDTRSPNYNAAQAFMSAQENNPDFVMCELVLLELYMALRNPAIFSSPYSARQAVEMCDYLYSNEAWQYADYNPAIRAPLWALAKKDNVAFRQIIDFRLALTLRFHGVTEFATANLKHFRAAGFKRVWNPLEA